MSGKPKRINHPMIAFLIGFIFLMLTMVVFAGVVHHLTISQYGPKLLKPINERFFKGHQSSILEDAKRRKELEEHEHFHRIVQTPQLPSSARPVCYICHSDYPHSKNKKIRSLLNMHTYYSVCQTCHIKKKPETDIIYKWYSPVDDNPQGPFFGTSYDPETGNLIRVKDNFSKLAPFFKKGNQLESAIQVQDAPLAQDYMKVRDQLTPEQRDGVKNKFHVNIKPKGYGCDACHSEKGLIDFKKLGFADNRRADLENLNIKGMITKYEVFYLPDLLTDTNSEPPNPGNP